MNTFTPPRKHLIILFVFFAILGTNTMSAQSIIIDSTFTADGEIFPFNPLDTTYGISISGRVVLNSDTSLVRVILTSDSTDHLMIFETYPYIASEWDFNFVRHSDETRYLDTLIPNSIRIQIIDATFELDTISINEEKPNNPKSLQEQYKAIVEDGKVSTIQNIIQLNDMLWFARRNPISDLSFSDKTGLFADNYNMCGLDYYVGGVYDPIPGVDSPPDDSPLVANFDWRSRHGANDPEKEDYYYQPGRSGEGWMTSIKDQRIIPECQELCYIYGPLAAIEGVANLYFNSDPFKDYDLSEQQVLNCNEAGTHCYGGSTSWTNEYISYSSLDAGPGVTDEEFYPRENYNLCKLESLPGEPQYQVRINNYIYLQQSITEYVKECLITKGPLTIQLDAYSYGVDHNMALVGYGRLKVNDIFHIHPDYGIGFITVEGGSDYIGQLYWIYKNSWGTGWGSSGYMYHTDSQFHPKAVTYYLTPVDDVLTEDDTIVLRDEDQDGYWNWGLPETAHAPEEACSQLLDSDDSENRIGPFDVNYFGVPVKPDISVDVSIGLLNPTQVENGGFYFFNTNNVDLTIRITNPGTAQLNLVGLSPVSIIQECHPDCFELDGPPETKICLNGGNTSFNINFSTLQGNESHLAVVRIKLNEADMDSYFDFALVYEECGYLGTQFPINGYTLWNDYRTCHQDIMINRNGILEITGHVAMAENSSIFVEQGGKLIINGGTITGSCQKLWKGVDVWGDPNQPQLPYNQGLVSVKNDGNIKHAAIAIETAKHVPPNDIIPSGGIVTCLDAKFKDNLVDVCLQPYQGIYSGIPQPNLSRFTRTRFETTDELYSRDYLDYEPHLLPDKHLMMKQVNGIHIEGCAFVNSSDVSDIRGIGIQSIGAGYYIEKTCKVYISPCPAYELPLFESLDYGIRAFNNTGAYTVSVDTAVFLYNHRGIFMSLVEHPTIIRSNFDLSDPGHHWFVDPNIVGLYMENFTTGFQVEENHFYGEAGQENTVGIHILNSGTEQNELYNNSFGHMQTGITAAGDNRDGSSPEETIGLCIKCNDFLDCFTDIYIAPELDGNGEPIVTENTGIAKFQGLPGEGNSDAAGNTFSENNGFNPNYWVEETCGDVEYTFHGIDNEINVEPSPVEGNIQASPDENAEYTKEGSCPSHLDNGIIPLTEMTILHDESLQVSYYTDTLLYLVDGGNTEGLNYEVQTSLPEEALVIRQNLLKESPFLSDTVLKSSIDKEEVLPNAMIRDILVANPQSAKSKAIISTISQRQDTMPGYMMEEIMQGSNYYGAKELLELELGKHLSKRAIAWKNINLFHKQDTSGIISNTDSLISLLQVENKLAAKYDLAFFMLQESDSAGVFAVLDSIPAQFPLNANELTELDLFEELFNLIYQMKTDSNEIDSLQIQTLTEIADLTNIFPSIYARNLLIDEGIISYTEPIYLANYLKSTIAPSVYPEVQSTTDYLNVFPNPSDNYCIIEYALSEGIPPGFISIEDLIGRTVMRLALKDYQNQIIIPTDQWMNGIYIVCLISNNRIIEAKKLELIKR